jgi:hypothetical protein
LSVACGLLIIKDYGFEYSKHGMGGYYVKIPTYICLQSEGIPVTRFWTVVEVLEYRLNSLGLSTNFIDFCLVLKSVDEFKVKVLL